MPLAENTKKISEEEYLKGELISEVRHEYINGYVYAMAGGSVNHNRIVKNVLYRFEDALIKGNSPCEVFSENIKVKEDKNSDYFYPDIFMVCGNDRDDDDYYKHSPVIIFEVLSKSTRQYDLTTKKILYFNFPTLQEYVVIEQDICEVKVFRKNNHWAAEFYFLGDSITFDSINVTLSVEDIYLRVNNGEIINYLKEKEEKQKNPKGED